MSIDLLDLYYYIDATVNCDKRNCEDCKKACGTYEPAGEGGCPTSVYRDTFEHAGKVVERLIQSGYNVVSEDEFCKLLQEVF